MISDQGEVSDTTDNRQTDRQLTSFGGYEPPERLIKEKLDNSLYTLMAAVVKVLQTYIMVQFCFGLVRFGLA